MGTLLIIAAMWLVAAPALALFVGAVVELRERSGR